MPHWLPCKYFPDCNQRFKRISISLDNWKYMICWKPSLPENCKWSSEACAKLASAALTESQNEWFRGCRFFGSVHSVNHHEDSTEEAWEGVHGDFSDQRSGILDCQLPLAAPFDGALYGDGGFVIEIWATYAAQARIFGEGPHCFKESDVASRPILARPPFGFGYEASTIHTAGGDGHFPAVETQWRVEHVCGRSKCSLQRTSPWRGSQCKWAHRRCLSTFRRTPKNDSAFLRQGLESYGRQTTLEI